MQLAYRRTWDLPSVGQQADEATVALSDYRLYPPSPFPDAELAGSSFGRAILLGDSIIPDCRPNHRERRSLAGLITPTLAGSRRLKTKAISLPLTGVLHGLGLVPT